RGTVCVCVCACACACSHAGTGAMSVCVCVSMCTQAQGHSVCVCTGAVFLLQNWISKRRPYGLQWKVLLSVACHGLETLSLSVSETQKCSNLWIYLETGQLPHGETRASSDARSPTEVPAPCSGKATC
uniref:Uncharacterized protein n=1 Tax=Crocodylus porosus TaxID=8502 RepID=A0A7M4EUS6_CROPO